MRTGGGVTSDRNVGFMVPESSGGITAECIECVD